MDVVALRAGVWGAVPPIFGLDKGKLVSLALNYYNGKRALFKMVGGPLQFFYPDYIPVWNLDHNTLYVKCHAKKSSVFFKFLSG